MFCKYCGTNNDDNAKFCAGCGRTLMQTEVKNTKTSNKHVGLIIGISALLLMGVVFLALFFAFIRPNNLRKELLCAGPWYVVDGIDYDDENSEFYDKRFGSKGINFKKGGSGKIDLISEEKPSNFKWKLLGKRLTFDYFDEPVEIEFISDEILQILYDGETILLAPKKCMKEDYADIYEWYLSARGEKESEKPPVAYEIAPGLLEVAPPDEPAATEPIAEAAPRVMDFLSGNVAAVIDDDVSLGYYDFEHENCGRMVTYGELLDYMCNDPESGTHSPTVYYSVIQKDGEEILLIKLQGMDIYALDDDSFVVFVVALYDDGFHITHDVESWCRSEVHMYDNGIIESCGSGGAGDTMGDGGYIDAKGKYNEVYHYEICGTGWIGSLFEYYCYPENYFSEQTISLAQKLDSESSSSAIALYTVGDKMYGCIEEGGSHTINELADSSEADGLEWKAFELITEEIRDSYIEALPGETTVTHNDISWIIL